MDEAGAGALVVVDQKYNIVSFVVRRCRAAGVNVAYLLGKAMKKSQDMFPGTAKTDHIGAEVIARMAPGTRCIMLPIRTPTTWRLGRAALLSPLAYATRRATMALNRLHAVLLKYDPASEVACEPRGP